ncbi:hypothetical protein [Sphingomonas sp. DT-51]|uniref:hypothetical protein n=1 Tax=Sphingomonas sp. DT-51 TaxID=3396165 RepID=UPI003F542390
MADDPAPFREEAARCREIAGRSGDGDNQRLMLRLARDDARVMLIEAMIAAPQRSGS